MNKKTKIILICIIALAILCFVIALLLNNKTYKITFDTNGGNYIASQEVKKGGLVEKPKDPTKEGYEFAEWDLDNEEYDFTTKVTKDITLKAIWKEAKKYKITFELDGKTKELEVSSGKTIDTTKLGFEEKEGYKIVWYDGDKEIDIETYKAKEDSKLTGKYVEVKMFTVTFDSDGGTQIESIKVEEGKTIKQPTEPKKDGSVFDNWYLDNKVYNFNTKVTKDITLKAKWVEDKNLKKYEVKFDSNGGSKVETKTVVEGKTVSKPTNPTKANHEFVEWQLNGKTYNFSSKVTGNITLKAVWKEIKQETPTTPDTPTPQVKHTVSFNPNGGQPSYPNQSIVDGGKATNPGSPKRDGYVFDGWDFDFNTPITSNITIIAKWKEASKWQVTFNLNGGTCTNCSTQTITDGGKATKPNDPTRSGYTFAGWDFDFNTPITENKTINAKWNGKNYVISYTVIDPYTPDVNLVLKCDGEVIQFQGVLINGEINKVLNRYELQEFNTLTARLMDGTDVTATVEA